MGCVRVCVHSGLSAGPLTAERGWPRPGKAAPTASRLLPKPPHLRQGSAMHSSTGALRSPTGWALSGDFLKCFV